MMNKKALLLIPVVIVSISLGVVFYPQEAEAHGAPSYSIDTMWVYEDATTTLGTGTAICTGVTITSGGTCSGTMIQGNTYRIELEVNEVVGDTSGSPTQFVMQSAVGNLDVAGVTPSYGVGGCDADRSGVADQTDWTPSTNSAAIDVDSGTTCSIAKNGVEYFYFIVTLDADDADDDTSTFFITDGTNTFTTGAVTFTVDPPPAAPTYSLDTMSIYQSESTTLAAGIPICTSVDITSVATCNGTLETGMPYRVEVVVSNSGDAAGSPTDFDFEDTTMTLGTDTTTRIFGFMPTQNIKEAGCNTNTNWSLIRNIADMEATSGTTCSISSGGGTATFWMIIIPFENGRSDTTPNFFIFDGAENDVSSEITITVNNAY